MRVTAYSDYALRVLTYAGLAGDQSVRIKDIAERYQISQSHLTKVVWRLAQHGFLETTRGRSGGLRLARAPEDINLGDVLRKIEERRSLVECFGAEGACVITPACAARRMFREAMEAFLTVFDQYTLADILARRSALAQALALELPDAP
ncbi:MAG: Rrf2 family transcriptional regulator [Neomegalonema sp.]|nr:Rrf2 family transcriptional regulator [Neomegalonema sp.]